MSDSQQVLAQQQQQQSIAMQQQQQQKAEVVQQNNQTSNQTTTPQIPVPPVQSPLLQQQQTKRVNIASICKCGQEMVQDIVNRTSELFKLLKMFQPSDGTIQKKNMANEKKLKIFEQKIVIKEMFKCLKIMYERCNENCQLLDMEYTHIESLIPLKEEWDMKSDEKKSSEAYRFYCEESKKIIKQVILKNRDIKEIIDHLRQIISEINIILLNMHHS